MRKHLFAGAFLDTYKKCVEAQSVFHAESLVDFREMCRSNIDFSGKMCYTAFI